MVASSSSPQHKPKVSTRWRIVSFWRRLTEPHGSIQKSGDRRRARLLSSLLAITIVLLVLFIIMRLLVAGAAFALEELVYRVGIVVVALLASAYGLSRTRHYILAGALTVAVTFIAAFAVVISFPENTLLHVTAALVILLSSLLLSLRVTTFIAAATITGMSLLVIFAQLELVAAFQALVIVFIFSAFIMVTATLRQRDLEQIKQQSLKLSESEERYRTLVGAASDAVISTDSLGSIVFWNKAAENIFGYSADEVVGKQLTRIMPERSRQARQRGLGRMISTGESRAIGKTVEKVGLKKDGSEFPLELSLARWKVGAGIFFTAIVRDITERKQAEEALRELDRMKSEFISNTSHELRTPLHSIQGFTKLMMQGKVPDPKTQKEFLTIIDKQSEQLGQMIDDLLDMSRIESGRFQIQKRRLSIKGIIHNALESFHSPANEKGIVISEDIPAILPKVEVDKKRLNQVMANLLSNAIKFSPGGGDILVKAEDRDNWLLVQVADHGIGIPKEAIPRLFERFYRVEDLDSAGGAGLGLHIAKQIIQTHGGRIWVESEFGKGSTFYFTLPKLPRKRVGELLVADGFISRQQLKEILKKQEDSGAGPPGGQSDVLGKGSNSYE